MRGQHDKPGEPHEEEPQNPVPPPRGREGSKGQGTGLSHFPKHVSVFFVHIYTLFDVFEFCTSTCYSYVQTAVRLLEYY